MKKDKIIYDETKTLFQTTVPVLVNHLNYGGHLGHDSLLSIIQEARMCWLRTLGLSEINLADQVGYLIISANVSYKSEAFHGDLLKVKFYIDHITKKTFSFIHEVSHLESKKIVSIAETTQLCYNTLLKKTVNIPEAFLEKYISYCSNLKA